MFGLIRYKSDDFSGNSNSNSEILEEILREIEWKQSEFGVRNIEY